MQLGLTILGLILACVAIWLGLGNKRNMGRVKGRLEGIEKKVGPIPHIRKMVGGKHK